MTLKTSSAKSGFLSVFFTQLKALRVAAALWLPALFLMAAASPYAQYGRAYGQPQMPPEQFMFNLSELLMFGVVFLLGLALTLAVLSFGYLHRKQAVDYYHALPVKRADMYLGRVLAAALLLFLGVAACCLGLTLGFLMIGVSAPQLFAMVWLLLPLIYFPLLASYFFIVLVLVLTGTLWEAFFSLAVLSAVFPVAVTAAGITIIRSLAARAPFYDIWVAAGSPFIFAAQIAPRYGTLPFAEMLPVILYSILLLAAFSALGFVFFRRRRSELAQNSLAPTGFKRVIRALTCTAAFFAGGLLGLEMADAYAGYLIGAVVGAVLAYLVLELILMRSLKHLMKNAAMLGAAAAAFVVFNVALAFGFIGMPSVPAVSEINAARVSVCGSEVVLGTDGAGNPYGHRLSWGGNPVRADSTYFDESGATSYGWASASFDAGHIERTRALTADILEEQRRLYFPYHPRSRKDLAYAEQWNTGGEDYTVGVSFYDTSGEERYVSFSAPRNSAESETLIQSALPLARVSDELERDRIVDTLKVAKSINQNSYEKGRIDMLDMEKLPDRELWAERIGDALLADWSSMEPIESDGKGAHERVYEVTVYGKGSLTLSGGILNNQYPAEGATVVFGRDDEWAGKLALCTAINLDSYGMPETTAVFEAMFAAAK